MTLDPSVVSRFQSFSAGSMDDVRVFFAPGRVNLIGEHIDYNGGKVFPAALKLGTWAMVRPRTDGIFRFSSTSFDKDVTVTGNLEFDDENDYANYPIGVIWALREAGVNAEGADFLFHGNLPNGAGLSSSASIELVTAVALNTLAQGGRDGVELALLGQKAENQFVGVNCGIMDQFASAMGKEDHAILLDCATLAYEHVPLRMPGIQLVITNTNKRRGLADSKYNERRAECEAALAALQSVKPGIKHLAQVSVDELSLLETAIKDETIRRRARHVITECHRVYQAADALAEDRLKDFGALLNQSHESLRDDYEVTGVELDTLAEAAWRVEGCLGSRMTGAGFGGCTVSLVQSHAVETFCAQVQAEYNEKTGLEASFYVSEIGDGAREVDKAEAFARIS